MKKLISIILTLATIFSLTAGVFLYKPKQVQNLKQRQQPKGQKQKEDGVRASWEKT